MQGYLYIGSRQALPTSVVSGGSTPALVEATNKTGAAVAKDDKVWINENDGSYELINYYSNSRDYLVNGSPTINDSTGVVSDFSSSKYLSTPTTFNFGSNDYEIVIKFKINSTASDYYGLLCSSSGYTFNVALDMYSKQLHTAVGDGNSWKSAFNGTTILALNKWYYFKVKKVSGYREMYLSEDNEVWSFEGKVADTYTYGNTIFYLGRNSSGGNIFNGEINLKETFVTSVNWLWVPYRPNVTEDTLTGTAQENIVNNATGSVSIGTASKISALTVAPSTSQQIINHSNVDGYKPVTVSAVTASIDSNITAENIKKDVQILGVTGSYEGSSGGDIVTAVNKTGFAIVVGDKVWIKKQATSTGTIYTENTASYQRNFIAGLSNDGNYFTHTTGDSNVNYPLWYINDLATGSVTQVGSSLIFYSSTDCMYRYSNQGDTFLCANFGVGVDNIRSSKMGDNSFQTNSSKVYLGYDLFALGNTASSGSNQIFIGKLEDGTFTTVTGSSIPGYVGYQGIATSPTDIYELYGTAKHYIVDRENLSYTSSNITLENVTSTFPLGVTSDGKIIITSNAYNSYGGISQYTNIQFLKVSGNTVTGYNISEYPERLKPVVQNTSARYFLCFNPNNNILTFVKYTGASSSSYEYGFFKYDTTTETWSEIYVDLSSVYNSSNWPTGVITTSQDMTRIGISVSNAVSYSGKLRVVQLQSVSGYKYVPYNYYDITQDTLTGFATENIAVDAEGDATTVLPEQLNVSVTVDANDATIFVE